MKDWLDRRPATARDWLRIVFLCVVFFLLLSNLSYFWGGVQKVLAILAPFAGGIVVAYVLDLPTRFFAQKWFHGKRGPAIVLSFLMMFAIVAILLALVVPQLFMSVAGFVEELPTYLQTVQQALDWVQARYGLNTAGLEASLQNSGAMLEQLLNGALGQAGKLADAAAGVAGTAMNGFVSLAVSIYLLTDKEGLLRAVRLALRAALPPRVANNVFAVAAMANRTFSGYIGGQLLDALLVGVETFVLMSLLHINYAPMIAVLVGVTNIIPVLGPFIGAVPGALILLLESPLQAVEFVLIIVVVQQIDGNFIAPRILGGATGLPGLGVLLAILVGGDLFGIPGMVVGVPALAVVVALMKQAVGAGLQARGLDPEQAAAPGPQPEPQPEPQQPK